MIGEVIFTVKDISVRGRDGKVALVPLIHIVKIVKNQFQPSLPFPSLLAILADEMKTSDHAIRINGGIALP